MFDLTLMKSKIKVRNTDEYYDDDEYFDDEYYDDEIGTLGGTCT